MAQHDTSLIRPFKQGVEIRTAFDYIGLYKFWSGVPGNFALINGQVSSPSQFSGSACDDVANISPVSYILAQSGSIKSSQRVINISLLDLRQPSGYIEPLDIRSSILFQKTYHTPSGYINFGSPVYGMGGSYVIDTLYRSQSGSLITPYNDVTRGSGNPYVSSYLNPGMSKTTEPWVDVDRGAWIHSGSILQSDMNVALSKLSGSRTDEYLPVGYKRGSAGYDFTDSIAFGGLQF